MNVCMCGVNLILLPLVKIQQSCKAWQFLNFCALTWLIFADLVTYSYVADHLADYNIHYDQELITEEENVMIIMNRCLCTK